MLTACISTLPADLLMVDFGALVHDDDIAYVIMTTVQTPPSHIVTVGVNNIHQTLSTQAGTRLL